MRNYARGQQGEVQNDKIYNAITLMIGREENSYVVMSGNVVNKNDLEKLTNKIDLLRSLDMAGLKALYKEQRRKPVTDNAPGAGLGLIDMARKSSQPLAYEVQEIDNKTAFFTLKAVV